MAVWWFEIEFSVSTRKINFRSPASVIIQALQGLFLENALGISILCKQSSTLLGEDFYVKVREFLQDKHHS
jgi:hypothetical protein